MLLGLAYKLEAGGKSELASIKLQLTVFTFQFMHSLTRRDKTEKKSFECANSTPSLHLSLVLLQLRSVKRMAVNIYSVNHFGNAKDQRVL